FVRINFTIHKSVSLIRKIGHELAYHPYNQQSLNTMKNNILLNNTPAASVYVTHDWFNNYPKYSKPNLIICLVN
ncbi:hypothetical protein DPY50_22050, partial [Salmonella enterica subsp. enterica serovar Mbandaka]|nr:hypothetical protein [Salmonella enterica subsp. enterica serovar Mbandaka]